MPSAADISAKLPPFGHALSGSGGAVLALLITYPLDVIKTRMQVQTKDSAFTTQYSSVLDAFLRIIHEEGVEGMYAGLASGLIGVASTNFAYFYWYSFIRQSYQKMLHKKAIQSGFAGKELQNALQIGTAMELGLGAMAGALAQLMTIPVSVITTRQQTQVVKEEKDAPISGKKQVTFQSQKKRRYTMVEMAKIIIDEESVFGLWKGLRPALVLTINPAITYGLFERLKGIWQRSKGSNGKLSSLETFLLGVVCKTLATVVTYPYIMAKVRLQWKAADYETNEKVRYKDALDVLVRVYKSEGLAGWFNGVNAQISKAVLSQALLFVIKDKLNLYTYVLFELLGAVSA
ncbi:hypothetical protein MP638_004528 [Amoeboaphelidium occidentale]|nr:hypothetical protein MP638_004528 [Amoeboaphelidium occidentale]